MSHFRIKGIVRIAQRVRKAISAPMLPADRDRLGTHIRETIANIELILRRHQQSPVHLPKPSLRAYQFLKHVDLNNVRLLDPSQSASTTGPHSAENESISFSGLRTFLDHVLDTIALAVNQEEKRTPAFPSAGRARLEAALKVIQRTASRLEHNMTSKQLHPKHLKPESREMAGWFTYFSEAVNYRAYLEAVRRALSVFDPVLSCATRWHRPLLIHYRPLRCIYRWRCLDDGTRIALQTPMIAFDALHLEKIALLIAGNRISRRLVNQAMMDEPYRTLAAELEAVAGVVEHAPGVTYDLAEVFDRVNTRYFSGRMSRPQLTWSRTLTGCVFGHYNFVRDTVMVSVTLDHPQVPSYVLDHVVHHELLHKKHGLTWQGNRRQAHTRIFRLEERTFEQYEAADQFLKRLAKSS